MNTSNFQHLFCLFAKNFLFAKKTKAKQDCIISINAELSIK